VSMRVPVTGGARFIRSELVRALTAAGLRGSVQRRTTGPDKGR